jgi:7,8-dihydroneopterin aldolase/epimerase/oxygenase
MDKIFLDGIRLEIRVGTTVEERSRPQLCGLVLVLEAKLGRAGKSGDVRKTVDYAAVFHTIEKLCSEKAFCLLEEVGHEICNQVLANYPVEKVNLRISKLKPFTAKMAAVGIELERRQKRKNPRH